MFLEFKNKSFQSIASKILYLISLLFIHIYYLLINLYSMHTREKSCSWEICYKAFSNRGNLNVHKRVHTGENQYERIHKSNKSKI